MAAEVPNYRTIMEEKKGLVHRVLHTVRILYVCSTARKTCAHPRADRNVWMHMLGLARDRQGLNSKARFPN